MKVNHMRKRLYELREINELIIMVQERKREAKAPALVQMLQVDIQRLEARKQELKKLGVG